MLRTDIAALKQCNDCGKRIKILKLMMAELRSQSGTLMNMQRLLSATAVGPALA